MGIPKFFRYISERYPLTSQLVQENKIPEFDNLYLDFNGIIHNCSHPNDEDAHFRMSEEQIFTSILAYVELLFGKMKPKKLFFIAVDGAAPRAKMNQQRSRRFRTAKEASAIREKADAKGEKLPPEKAFVLLASRGSQVWTSYEEGRWKPGIPDFLSTTSFVNA
ncbi:hypothetical protein PAXRUDRAFT_734321 [Paxillus rubicundulus Ve08.2h10]|uniref:Xrn1 N-terminal domain-containing protein n=1 Tax=Paxillus rubicundulus Ve08.2h10 TaxID=930991 RepID=A0A0D0DR37_9AGAM|nr:hypothetical protein PAXRUDRAFT_734321 [Paxillus rubicundulus Ve08.2h10]